MSAYILTSDINVRRVCFPVYSLEMTSGETCLPAYHIISKVCCPVVVDNIGLGGLGGSKMHNIKSINGSG